MKAVCALTEKEYKQYKAIYANLQQKTKGTTRSDWFNNFEQHSGYAHYTFKGQVSEKLCELLGRAPTPTEIIMLVDNGFSHFGASCSLNINDFSGKVNTD